MICHSSFSKLNALGSLNSLERRNIIELYCNIANLLPINERMLFHLYYKYGYSTIEISQLLMKHHVTIARRLKKIAIKINNMMLNIKNYDNLQ